MLADNDCVESFYECSFLLSESRIVGHHDSFCQFMCASAIIAARSIIWDNMATRSNQVSMQNTIQPSTTQLSKYFCQQFLNICIWSTNIYICIHILVKKEHSKYIRFYIRSEKHYSLISSIMSDH